MSGLSKLHICSSISFIAEISISKVALKRDNDGIGAQQESIIISSAGAVM
jgi:hypothetical protein